MKILIAFLAMALLPPALRAQDTKAKPSPLDWNKTDQSPRSRALELTDTLARDGYKTRDGYWLGSLEKYMPVIIEVNLFEGNDYWFSAASMDSTACLKVSLFDAEGRPAGYEAFKDSAVAAAGISALRTGPHFVRLLITEGDKADACMVYSYK